MAPVAVGRPRGAAGDVLVEEVVLAVLPGHAEWIVDPSFGGGEVEGGAEVLRVHADPSVLVCWWG